MNRDVTLPSGTVLKLSTAPFAEAKALYMAVAAELAQAKLELRLDQDVTVDLIKTLLFTALSSRSIDQALHACMQRATYGGKRCSDPQTWEPAEAREDYLDALAEVAHHNLAPFTRSLSRLLSTRLLPAIGASQK